LERLADAKPATVILDLMMPRMDGFEVLEAMRYEAAWRDIPVVIVTAKDLSHEEIAQLNGRVERVFQKGAYDRAELIDTVRAMITRRIAKSRAARPPRRMPLTPTSEVQL
jgi:DNA-binding response OmpR family regulator